MNTNRAIPTVVTLLAAGAMALVGCRYDTPFTGSPDGPIDPALLGHWEIVPDSGDPQDAPERMIVLRHSESEYSIHYPTAPGKGLYFRGHPVTIGEFQCVQLQLIGTGKGPVDDDDRKFDLVTYSLDGDRLSVRVLNTKRVAHDIATTEALREAFLAKAGEPDLFDDPGVFRRLESGD